MNDPTTRNADGSPTDLARDEDRVDMVAAAEVRHAYVKLGMQVGVSLVAVAFAASMIVVRGQEGIYLPVITGVLGFWLPSPRTSFAPRKPPKGLASVEIASV